MTINNFIPTMWAGSVLANLNDKHVYVDLCNRDYEGEISGAGDSVRINSIGRVTVAAYTKNSSINAPETLDDASQTLLIDQQNYFNFEIDNIDKAQQTPKLMSAFTVEAAWALADVADADVAAVMTAAVPAANTRAAATAVGTAAGNDDAYEILVDLGVLLDNTNTPQNGRWAVVPNWFYGMLLKDPRFVSFGTSGNAQNLKNGAIGEAAGFKIVKSNNVPVTSTEYDLLAGVNMATTFAEQIVKTEAFSPEGSFSDALKGLHVYGRKVVRPDQLAKCVVTQA